MKNIILAAAVLSVLGCSQSGFKAISSNGDGIAAGAALKGVPDSLKPNDEFFHEQWALHNDGTQEVGVEMDDLHTVRQKGKAGVDIGYLEAREKIAKLAKNPVLVAVIDYGVDPTHPDLQGRIADGGWDEILDVKLTTDPQGHGTHVSGIIAANANNHEGVTGLTPSTVKVLPINVLSDQYSNFVLAGNTLADYVAKAIPYAVEHKANVINMSLGWPKIIDSQNVRDAIDDAVKKGVLVVVSAGNNRKDHPTYPCSHPGVLCVGAISNTGNVSFYSNYGMAVDVLAPGDEILSTWPAAVTSDNFGTTNYEKLSGTSQATPFVTGLAAILKSIDPKISVNEMIARIEQSAAEPPAAGVAQYGLINISRAIDAKPVPTYSPDFKSIEDDVSLDESSLTANGTIHLKNLWAPATQVVIGVKVNGVDAGSLNLDTMDGDGALTDIPWSYKFGSLDESAIVHLVLTISDAVTQPKTFEADVTVSRVATNVGGSNQHVLPFDEKLNADDLIVTADSNRVFSRLLTVGMQGSAAYSDDSIGPMYYRANVAKDKSINIDVFDAHHLAQSTNVQIPNIQRLLHVMRIDMKGNGEMDWCIIGSGHVKEENEGIPKGVVQFYFLDPNFKPLFGNASIWQAEPETAAQADKLLNHSNFEDMNMWVKATDGLLAPGFLLQDVLPKLDNFTSLDARAANAQTHYFYMAPPANWRSTKAGDAVTLEIHAVDGKQFANAHDKQFIVNVLPQTRADMKAGHVRLLLADDTQLSAHVSLLDVPDVTHATLTALPKWDLFSAVGTAIPAKPGSGNGVSMTYLKFYDEKTGGLAWAKPDTSLEPLSEFKYSPSNFPDPIKGMISAYDSPRIGHLWILFSNFDLVAKGTTPGGKPFTSTFPLERETTDISDDKMAEFFSPFLIGPKANPQPAIFVDSTALRGNLISMLTWNAKTLKLEKPLRYSMQVPSNCVNMAPVYLNGDTASLAIPLLCHKDKKASLHIVQPQK